MKLEVRFDRLVCGACSNSGIFGRGVKLAYMAPEIILPGEDERPPRKVTIKVTRLVFEDLGDGRARGKVVARVPCMNCEGQHELDVTDMYHAPQLHLQGASLCSCGKKMTFERAPSWSYEDDGERGGTVVVTGILRCSDCQHRTDETLRFAAPDMESAMKIGSIDLDLAKATCSES